MRNESVNLNIHNTVDKQMAVYTILLLHNSLTLYVNFEAMLKYYYNSQWCIHARKGKRFEFNAYSKALIS